LFRKPVYNGAMQKDLGKFSTMQKSVVSENETADSSGRNNASSLIDQANSIKGLREKQKIVEKEEQNIAEQNIDTELNAIQDDEVTSENLHEFLTIYFPNNIEATNLANQYIVKYKAIDRSVTENHLAEYILRNIDHSEKRTKLQTAILLKENLTSNGKTGEKILKTLIATFKKEPELKTFVENWGKILTLYDFAKTKPSTERKAIETIISNSNFTTDNSFDMVLFEIERSSDISTETKLDIQRTFNTKGINTVKSFDYTLKQEKKYKKNIEKKIQSRNSDIENLNDEIQNLNTELDKLSPDDPKRSELKARIKEKGGLLKTYKEELSVLNEAKPDKVQFQLRNDLMGVLNPDGSRSINVGSENFTIQLPGNNLPLMGMKNIRSINVTFPYLVLRSQQISDEIFAPDLVDNGVPTKGQRNMAHIILSSLGIDDNWILSENDIVQLKNDLTSLTDSKSGKSGRECLVELGIYDVASQNVNKAKFKKALRFIRENRMKNLDYHSLVSELKSQ